MFKLTAFFWLMVAKIDPLKLWLPGVFHWALKGEAVVRQDQHTGEQVFSVFVKREETLEAMC